MPVEGTFRADFKHLVQGVPTLATTQQELIEKELASSLNVAENQVQQRDGLSVGTEMITWQATNQLSNNKTMVSLPKMQIGSEWLGQIEDKETPVPG